MVYVCLSFNTSAKDKFPFYGNLMDNKVVWYNHFTASLPEPEEGAGCFSTGDGLTKYPTQFVWNIAFDGFHYFLFYKVWKYSVNILLFVDKNISFEG